MGRGCANKIELITNLNYETVFTPAVKDPTAIMTVAGKRLSVKKPTIRQRVRTCIIAALATLAPRQIATELERDTRMYCAIFTNVATVIAT